MSGGFSETSLLLHYLRFKISCKEARRGKFVRVHSVSISASRSGRKRLRVSAAAAPSGPARTFRTGLTRPCRLLSCDQSIFSAYFGADSLQIQTLKCWRSCVHVLQRARWLAEINSGSSWWRENLCGCLFYFYFFILAAVLWPDTIMILLTPTSGE